MTHILYMFKKSPVKNIMIRDEGWKNWAAIGNNGTLDNDRF